MWHPIFQMIGTTLFYGSIAGVFAIAMAPLQFLKVIRQQTGKTYTTIFYDTIHQHGSSAFFRGAMPYAIMQFWSSMAFGLSEYIAEHLIQTPSFPLLFAIIVRATLGGILETLCSAYAELQEITKNKGALVEAQPTLWSVFIPILLRNVVFWYGSIISYEIATLYKLTTIASIAMGLIFGILSAFCSMIFDIIATKNCGALESGGVIQSVKAFMNNNSNEPSMFTGSFVRMIQISVYTMATILTMFCLDYIKTH